MKIRKKFKTLSIFFCFLLIGTSLVSCTNKGGFYSGAKKHLRNKYDVKCDSLIYHKSVQKGFNAAEYGIVELDNGERVIVSLADGNYADSYELLELYDAWMKEISLELEADVALSYIMSEGEIVYDNGEKQLRTLGTFLETSEKRYNASNVNEFIDDYYDFTFNEEMDFYIVQKDPTQEWIDSLAEKMENYRRKIGAKTIDAYVDDSYNPTWLQVYPDDYYHIQSGDGIEYTVRCDMKSHHRYKTYNYRDKIITIWLEKNE